MRGPPGLPQTCSTLGLRAGFLGRPFIGAMTKQVCKDWLPMRSATSRMHRLPQGSVRDSGAGGPLSQQEWGFLGTCPPSKPGSVS